MCHRKKKNHKPTDFFWKQLLKTQHQYQGKLAWLKRNKQEIQSLKINLCYPTLPFEQFDSFTTVPKHKATQLHWLPFPWSPAEAVQCSNNKYRAPLSSTPLTRGQSKRHPTQLVLSEGALTRQ